jgi:phospholipid/cholesterol/gamma-HCH transport system ATP-binding protein
MERQSNTRSAIRRADQGSASQAAVSVRNLRMGYGTRVLIEDASFDVHAGEIVVILGGSGSGKSSLMKNLIGLYPPLAGDVLIRGVSLVRAGSKEKAALQTLEMKQAESLMPSELSGGMLKRVAIARAMALGCDILLLDEPSAGLDPVTAANLDLTLLSLRKNLGVTLIVVTHELESIFAIADRAIMLDPISRTILADDKPETLRDRSADVRVRQFFNRQPDEQRASEVR